MSSCDKNSNQTFEVSKLKVSSETDQIMIVVPESYTSYSAKFYYYIKNKDEKWDEMINSEAHIGKNGLGKEKEGDVKTPVGKYKFNYYFGIADNPGTKMPYVCSSNCLSLENLFLKTSILFLKLIFSNSALIIGLLQKFPRANNATLITCI